MWQQWVNAVLGLAIIVVPFLGLTSTSLMWTLIVGGLAVTVLALWGASQETMERNEQYGQRRQA